MTTPPDDRIEWQVHRLLHRYVAAVDAQDVDAVAACFGTAGVLEVRGVERTGPAIAEFYRDRLTVPTLHFITGIAISARPDGLAVSTCGLFAIEMPGPGWNGVAGRYDDVIRVGGDTATFERRTITLHQRVSLTHEG